jgi:hypothetical protein
VVAGLVVTAALATYVGTVDDALDRYGPERDLATRALDAVGDHLRQDGAAIPSRLRTAEGVAPSGRRLNATLASADGRWDVGPPVPDPTARTVDRARRRIAIRRAPGRVRTGWLEVAVW